MAAVNRVFLLGHLGKDPEVRFTPSGQAVANFTMATSESWNDKQGQRQDRTEWHRIVVWGKTAELCGEYLTKGRQVYLEGKLQTRTYDDKDGKKVYTTEIVANTVQFIGSKDGSSGGNGGSNRAPQEDHGYSDAAPAPQAQPQAREPQQHAMAGMDGGGSRGAYPSPPTQQGGGSRHSYREAGYDDVDDAPFHHTPRRAKCDL